MTGEELLFLAQHGKTQNEGEVTVKSSAKEQKHFETIAQAHLFTAFAFLP